MIKTILIVEDDSTFANALSLVARKVGYIPVVCSKPDEALALLEKEKYSIAFIDCLLPQYPGTELAKKIRTSFGPEHLAIVMMSGVFTDKQTMRDVINDTKAQDFLKKPFDANYILNYLEKTPTVIEDNPLQNNIFTLYDRLTANPGELQKNLTAIKGMNGLEILPLLSALVDLRWTGGIEFSKADNSNKSFFIQLNNGNIFKVESGDAQSFVGKLLLSKGYIFVDDLEAILRIKSSKKLATRLLEENLLSPHAFDEVLQEQMSIRIAKIIPCHDLKVKFHWNMVAQDTKEDIYIAQEEFYLLLGEWIVSQTNITWLAKEFMKWYDYSFKLGPKYDPDSVELKNKYFNELKDVVNDLTTTQSLGNLITKYSENEKHIYQILFYLLCRGLVNFSEKLTVMSDEERFIRIKKMHSRLTSLNLIEVFDLIGGKKGMSPAEVRSLQVEFVKKYLGVSPKQSIVGFEKLYSEVKKIIEEASELFMNPVEVSNYEIKIDAQYASEKISTQEKVAEARKLLALNQHQKALKILQNLPLRMEVENKELLLIWARLSQLDPMNKSKELLELLGIFNAVPREEKMSSLGNFIQGLIEKNKGDLQMAKKYFDSAIALDKNFIEARRELNQIQASLNIQSKKKTPDFLKSDLKEVVGYFLKGTK